MKHLIAISFIIIFTISNIYSKDIANYHRLVNKSELFICKKDFTTALICYDSAFALNNSGFIQDFYNASICAIKIGNFDKSIIYCDSLVLLGCGLNFFIKKNSYKPLRENRNKWLEFLSSYQKNSSKSRKQINWKLRTELEILNELDQSAYRLRNIDKRITKDTLIYLTKEITNQLINIFKKKGYPSEKILGAFISNDTMLDMSPLNVLIRHSYQSRLSNLTIF